MLLRTLGNTDLHVSPLGLGVAALGRPGYSNLSHAAHMRGGREPEAMEARAHALLDAARSHGRDEAFLAHFLHDRRHDPKGLTASGPRQRAERTAALAGSPATHWQKRSSLAWN
jgi:hypothetical protein